MIYTSITGEYDGVRSDVNVLGGYNRFCSDRENAKIYKVLSHRYVEDEWSVWIDGNLTLKVPEEELIKLAGDRDVAVFRHPNRNSIYEEAEEVIRLGLDKEITVREQVRRYKEEGFPDDEGLGACFLIIRKNTEKVRIANAIWWAEICRGSVRDQISFPYAFYGLVNYIDKEDIYNNKYFTRKPHKKPRV